MAVTEVGQPAQNMTAATAGHKNLQKVPDCCNLLATCWLGIWRAGELLVCAHGVLMPTRRMNMTSPSRKERSSGLADSRDLAARAAKNNRDRLYQPLVAELDDQISLEELDIHFTHMPVRYWGRVNAETARRHMLMIHDFFARLHDHHSDGTAPIVRWQHVPDRGITEVEMCTWDRIGLMAKVAGAMAAVGLNIVRADIFTRADNVVLDLIQVTANGRHVIDNLSLVHMEKLLANSLAATGDAEKNTARYVPIPSRTPMQSPIVSLEADGHDVHTLLNLEADDRVGLLYDIFTALAECNVNVAHAIITTEQGRAGDVFFLTDNEGRKITDPTHLENIHTTVLNRLRI
jgi:[protein-PII] uridylyltransferase